jgi:ubiquinone/menaquinone biosynthesis C-methylase UbiE
MVEQPRSPRTTSGPAGEIYTQRDCPAFETFMAARTASREATFFLPQLRPGMRVLDAGCGPGSITLGLAHAVQPGEVIGVDLQPAQVERARGLAAERGVGNVRFETADLYELPFPDSAFDAVFSHGVVMHLREPLRAIAEMRRVLHRDGIIGLRDPYVAAGFVSPATPLIEQFGALLMRVREHNGSHPLVGAQYRGMLLEAGFARSEATASVEYAGSLEATRRFAAWRKTQLEGLARTALAQGWMDQSTIDAMAADFNAWGNRPDAFAATIWCEAIGWAGG